MKQNVQEKKQPHPRDTTNLFSKLSFFYTINLFRRGYRKDLEKQDLYEVLSSCSSSKLGDELENEWENERKTTKQPSLLRVLWRCYGKHYLILGIIQLVFGSVLSVVGQEAMSKLISYFSPQQTEITENGAYLYASTVIVCSIVGFIYSENYMLAVAELGIRIRTALCSLIYRKSLKLTGNALSEITTGQIVTLITKDVDAFLVMVEHLNDIWIGLIQIVLICYLIYAKAGVAIFSGVGFFLVIMPIQLLIAKAGAKLRLKNCTNSDARLETTQEALSIIKVIKMYTWESFFENRISTIRNQEMNAVRKIHYLRFVSILIGILSARIGFFILIFTYIWLGNNLTAGVVYFIMGWFFKLGHTQGVLIPQAIFHAGEFYTTLKRVMKLLKSEELPIFSVNPVEKGPKIRFKNVKIQPNNKELFGNISLTIKRGLNIVVGHMGSGKSVFLQSILQSVKTEGTLQVYGKFSYASQEPWLFPSTIRKNVLFGEHFDCKRYQQVLSVCSLAEDLEEIGDNTIVGDGGLNLSKGQKARINLARAVYKNCDIYLLDDCLSSLDAAVSDKVFSDCIRDFLSNKLVVFVTNNTEHISQANCLLKIVNNNVELIQKCTFEKVAEYATEFQAENVEESGNEVYDEDKKSGKVELQVYKRYFQFGGSCIVISLILFLYLSFQISVNFTEKLMGNWITFEQNMSSFMTNNSNDSNIFENKRSSILGLYGILLTTCVVLVMVKFLFFYNFVRKASINIHRAMISSVINAKIFFFDTNFIGNILNRFSKDLYTVDEYLPFLLNSCIQLVLKLAGALILIVIVNIIFLIPVVIIFAIGYYIRMVYQPTGRSLKRLDALTRSPVIGHLKSSLDGLITIRAFQVEKILAQEFDRHQDLYTSANYTMRTCLQALSFYLDALCSVFTAVVIGRFLIADRDTTVGNVGLAITQAFSISAILEHGIRQWCELENQMTSVERALEYTEVPQEAKEGKIKEKWPVSSEIQFNNVSLHYGNKKILNNLSFKIESCEKIGIIGRTGAGKSSIISALLRLYETEGKILIDNIDIKTLPLSVLRRKIAIIPQDPVLFSGTIRENIDPLTKYTDEKIWKAIETVKMKAIIDNLNGSSDLNLSAGQKQLFCLARAILAKSKIVVLDEATANMDQETDSLIREILKEKFDKYTVLIIAHKMASIMDMDKILVISKGEIAEFDKPENLLKNEDSLFYKMAKSQLYCE